MRNITTTKFNSEISSIEPFLYGKRLKATLTTYKDRNCYKVTLYKHNKEIYKNMLFFNSTIKAEDYEKQLALYNTAYNCVQAYLKVCKY